ncbi:MAG: hypothetical protein A3K76_06860 [Euryarchaeota archaeon RBG_13_57_23]|nr:MAG: hypothetical protein A3K76_06860 [Euryarchaeota archaeon RBG_13_57_23]
MILRLAIIGFGNVGQEFARMLLVKREWLLRNRGLDVEVLAIATKTKGSLLSRTAIDLEKVLSHLKTNGTFKGLPECCDLPPLKMINNCDADMMIELTPLNIENGQPAIEHIKAALDAGMDVVTANKGPVAWAYDELRDRARARNLRFRFEGAVMDGTPVFNLVERTLPGCQVIGLEGVLNSTSNFVVDEMAKGRTMESAIKEAQAKGIAEADPSLDIDGWDAVAKITALANVIMEANLTPKQVEREGIRDLTAEDIKNASAKGGRIRLIARAARAGDRIRLTVKPQVVGPDSVFWSVEGTSSALKFETDLMGDLTIVESGPGTTQTAYAIFSDMLLTVEAIRSGTLY